MLLVARMCVDGGGLVVRVMFHFFKITKSEDSRFEFQRLTISVTYSGAYRGYPINACKHRKWGIITDIMGRIIDQVEALLSWYSRITVIRIDCHFPKVWKTDRKLENDLMSDFTKMLKSKLRTKEWLGHDKLISGWVYEVGSKEGRGHYHFFMGFEALYLRLGGFDGGVYTGIWGLVKDCWDRAVGGHIQIAGSHTVNRSNVSQIHSCVKHLSYLAKKRDKQFGLGFTAKNYALSRLKRKTLVKSDPRRGCMIECHASIRRGDLSSFID